MRGPWGARGWEREGRTVRRTGLAVVLVLAGCGLTPVADPNPGRAPETLSEDCCTTLRRFPAALVALVEPKAERKEAFTDDKRLRAPYLADKPAAWDYVMARLRPMDILTTSDKGILRGQLMPGYFSHSLLYVGTEAQLRAEGLWNLPALVPFHDEIRGGAVFYEAIVPKVTFARPDTVFAADAVGVFRPVIPEGERRAALERALAQHGKPFDWHFDSRTTDCFYCAELIDTALPGLDLPRQQAYGREVIPPDTFARMALSDPARLRPIAYVYGTRGGAMSVGVDVLAATLAKHW